MSQNIYSQIELAPNHMANRYAWKRYRPKYEILEWQEPLFRLKEDEKKFKYLTEVRMAETMLKFETGETKYVQTYGKENSFDLQLIVPEGSQLRPIYFNASMTHKFLKYTGIFETVSYKALVNSSERNIIIAKLLQQLNPTITLMVNNDGYVGAVGSERAQGIYTIPMLEFVEEQLLSFYDESELDFKYEFLGTMNGIRAEYKVKEPVDLGDQIGRVHPQVSVMSQNDFSTAFRVVAGIFRSFCWNGMYIGNPIKDPFSGKDIEPFTKIIHTTPFEKAKNILTENLENIGRSLSIMPNLLQEATKHSVSLEDAKMFCYGLRNLPKRGNKGTGLDLDTYDALIRSLYGRYYDREPNTLSLYDIIEKISEVASDKSPIAREAKWNDHFLKVRFLCAEALNPESFTQVVKENREQWLKDKEKEEAKEKAKWG